jgi:hypothetical protein
VAASKGEAKVRAEMYHKGRSFDVARQARLESARVVRMQSEAAECTFSPRTAAAIAAVAAEAAEEAAAAAAEKRAQWRVDEKAAAAAAEERAQRRAAAEVEAEAAAAAAGAAHAAAVAAAAVDEEEEEEEEAEAEDEEAAQTVTVEEGNARVHAVEFSMDEAESVRATEGKDAAGLEAVDDAAAAAAAAAMEVEAMVEMRGRMQAEVEAEVAMGDQEEEALMEGSMSVVHPETEEIRGDCSNVTDDVEDAFADMEALLNDM